MTDFVDDIEQHILEWIFHGSDMPAAHSNVYVGLHTGDPNDDGTAETEPGTENEVAASDYSRAAVGATSSNWALNTADQQATVITNDTDVTFGIAESDWGTITHWSVWTGPQDDSGAIPLFTTSVDSSSEITQNDQVRWPAGELSFELD